MHQITHAEAKAHMTDIETRLKTIYQLAHLPEKTRRQILNLAGGANNIAGQIAAHERKVRNAPHK